MNKTLLIGIAVGAVVIIAAAGVLLLNSKKSEQPAAMTSDTTEQATQSGNQPRSLRDLMSFADNQTCTFQDDRGNSGAVYVSNNMMRGDFKSESAAETGQSHIIVRDDQMYLWFDENEEGFKTSLQSVGDLQTDESSTSAKSVDIDKKVDYNCTEWNVDTSVFSVPSTITFTDYSTMMESAAEMMEDSQTEGRESQCAACNSLPASAKEQCLQTLQCN